MSGKCWFKGKLKIDVEKYRSHRRLFLYLSLSLSLHLVSSNSSKVNKQASIDIFVSASHENCRPTGVYIDIITVYNNLAINETRNEGKAWSK